MRRNYLSFIILILTVLLTLTACTGDDVSGKGFDIPEAEKIQKVLDDISAAVMENNIEKIDSLLSEGCPRRQQELDSLSDFMGTAALENYTQTIVGAERLKDGVVCTVNVSFKGASEDKSIDSSSLRNMYFVFEKGAWKVGDYNYYPLANPTVIVGNESSLYDAAYNMSEALDSKLRTDAEHLQTYGDIILVGEPYDNASILDLEEKGLTYAKVTEEYPGSGLGIVQIISNIESYRYVVIIQGSDQKTAEDSIDFMARYIKDKRYLNPGVYFIEGNALRGANPLETTTLVTLDPYKVTSRLREVQKYMEANMRIMEEELQSEKEQLLREQGYVYNKYSESYSEAFSRYKFHPEKSFYDSMALINANFTDSRLCSSVFQLPYGNSIGTVYAYADYAYRNIGLAARSEGGSVHTLTAHEIRDSANELEISALSASMLRLAGFSADEVYSITAEKGNNLFLNIDSGYAIKPGSPVVHTPKLKLNTGRLQSAYNDGAFIDYESNDSNVDPEDVSAINSKAADLFKLSGRLPEKPPKKVSIKGSELKDKLSLPYDSEDIYSLMRNTFIVDDGPGSFSTLDEAREQLRSAMGRLLAVKSMRYIVNTASRYPASQFDCARYAAGLINVEHPNAYAEAAEASILLAKEGSGISNLLSGLQAKTQKILDVLRSIEDDDRDSEMFFFPDYCIARNSGSHWDKALLAFGLYSHLIGNTTEAYVALGESTSYLVFREEEQWKYLDCRYNIIRDYLEDDIYAAFNKNFAYNRKLDLGAEPDFIR